MSEPRDVVLAPASYVLALQLRDTAKPASLETTASYAPIPGAVCAACGAHGVRDYAGRDAGMLVEIDGTSYSVHLCGRCWDTKWCGTGGVYDQILQHHVANRTARAALEINEVVRRCLEIGERHYGARILRAASSNGRVMVDLDSGPEIGFGTGYTEACADLLAKLRERDQQRPERPSATATRCSPLDPECPEDPFKVPT